MRPQQMPLRLPHPAHYGIDSFVVGAPNAAALSTILDATDPVLLLSGPEGSGKTHLAHIWAGKRNASILSADQLAGRDPVELFGGRDAVVEDIDCAGLAEAALFHLLNAGRETGARLLLTARKSAAELAVVLPDLASRLRLAKPVALLHPDEALLRPVLVKLFADRQLLVDKTVIDFVLPRIERSFSAVAQIVEQLDREALAEGRAITRPMAARILAEIELGKQEFMDLK